MKTAKNIKITQAEIEQIWKITIFSHLTNTSNNPTHKIFSWNYILPENYLV